MNLKTTTLYIYLLSSFSLFSQENLTIGFKKNSEKIEVDFSNEKFELPFSIITSFAPQKNDSIIIKISFKDNELKKNQKFLLKGSNNEYKIIFEKKTYPIIKNSGEIYLQLEFEKKSIQKKIEKKTNYITEKEIKTFSGEYNLFLGGNFDLEEQLVPNTFYSEIDVFLPNLFDFKNKTLGKNIGLTASIYKNNSLSISNNSKNSLIYTIKENSITDSTLTIKKDRVNSKRIVTISNIGLSLSFIKTLNPNSNGNFKGYLSLSAELIDRKIKSSFNNSTIYASDSITNLSDFDNNLHGIKDRVFKSNDTFYDVYDTYYGFGFIGIYDTKRLRLYFDAKYGFGHSGSGSINTNPDYFNGEIVNSVENRPERKFAAFKFYLLEKKLGIKLNGELRKFFNINQRPYININLSKSINLDTLKDLFTHKENKL